MIQFDLPKNQSSIIKVIGIGGGGSNAVNHMFSHNIEGVDFIICNTDSQALAKSSVPNKIQLGPQLTSGLGAGAKPEVGRQATEESIEEIKRILEVNTKMAFVTAGMGGGTGTGGAPIISKLCKELGILTVGIVTTPFAYEGGKRMIQAQDGIEQMKDYVDTLLVISNDKVRHQYGNLKVKEAFAKADNVLATAAKCITDVISSTGQINVDFADVCTVMRNGGVAILGSGNAAGEDRAQEAIEAALNSPLLNDNDIHGAKWILININSAEGEHEFTMDEVEVIQSFLRAQSGPESDVILGLGYDNTLGDQISVTIIATGFEHKEKEKEKAQQTIVAKPKPVEEETIVMVLGEDTVIRHPAPKAEVEDEMAPRLTEFTGQTILTFDFDEKKEEPAEPETFALNTNVTTVSNEVEDVPAFLRKPSNIYVPENQAKNEEVQPAVTPAFSWTPTVETPSMDMKIVETNEPVEETVVPVQTNFQMPVNNFIAQSPQMQEPVGEDVEELRRRAMERINKLRSLSFNMNGSSDANSEFEQVPAYMRRNMDLQHQTGDVENFYSSYTVKANDNNQAEISTINTYLDGKKPD